GLNFFTPILRIDRLQVLQCLGVVSLILEPTSIKGEATFSLLDDLSPSLRPNPDFGVWLIIFDDEAFWFVRLPRIHLGVARKFIGYGQKSHSTPAALNRSSAA